MCAVQLINLKNIYLLTLIFCRLAGKIQSLLFKKRFSDNLSEIFHFPNWPFLIITKTVYQKENVNNTSFNLPYSPANKTKKSKVKATY